MTEIPDDEVEAVAAAYYRRKTGKPWLLLSEKRKQRVLEDVGAALAAVRPRWEKQLAELRSEIERVAEQALLDRIAYIGEAVPGSLANDPRPKFVLLGTPAEFLAAFRLERGMMS